jgi:hypothetical protein
VTTTMFDRTQALAAREMAASNRSEFAVWMLGYLTGIEDRYLRYAALDGVMAALGGDR